MSNFTIQLSAQADHSDLAGAQLAPASSATIEFFDQFQPSTDATTISLSPADGLNFKDLTGTSSLGFGDLRCISQACVSDVSVIESTANLASIDPALLANTDSIAESSSNSMGIQNFMNEQMSFESLNADLLNAMPQLKHALDGNLSHSELSQLILDIQAQVLELNGLSQELFGSLTNDVHTAVHEFSELDSSALLTSMQIDSSYFAEPVLSATSHSLAFETTLDGLFTSPEAFPLTLDFSNPSSIREASELFASTGAGSSISSSASDLESNGGLVDGGSISSNLS